MAKSLAATFASELRAARRARGWTQSELAERADIAVEVCGRLERGRVLPRADTLVRLALALGTTTDALLGIAPAGTGEAQAIAAEPQAPYVERPDIARLVRRLRDVPPRTVRSLEALVSSFVASRPRRGRAR